MQLQFGIDVLMQRPGEYKHLRIALVTNDAATTCTGELSRVALWKNDFNVCKLFSPEHGIGAAGEDGAFQNNSIDAVTGLPVISLYSNKLATNEEDLENIDVVMFDTPDVGCRFYTYLWTMTYVMEACAKFQKPFLLLDRPNPIGADLAKAEGPILDEENCSSFIGRWSIPVKHCCTLGELALYFAATKINGLRIDVIKVENYQRQQTAIDFLFAPTSPAIKDAATAMLYPGTGLLEGVNVNEGRGTSTPFRICGATWIQAQDLQDALQQRLSGVIVKPVHYKPVRGWYANEHCNGVELLLADTHKFFAVQTGITLLQTLQQLYPQQLKERIYKTNANPTGKKHLDKLLGVKNAFMQLQNGNNFATDVKEEWKNTMKDFLLY